MPTANQLGLHCSTCRRRIPWTRITHSYAQHETTGVLERVATCRICLTVLKVDTVEFKEETELRRTGPN